MTSRACSRTGGTPSAPSSATAGTAAGSAGIRRMTGADTAGSSDWSPSSRSSCVDGTHMVVATDASWRASTGEIRSADLYDGSTIDLRLASRAGTSPGFDDTCWSPRPACPSTRPRSSRGPRRRSGGSRSCRSGITGRPTGRSRLDGGQNISGWVRLTVRGERRRHRHRPSRRGARAVRRPAHPVACAARRRRTSTSSPDERARRARARVHVPRLPLRGGRDGAEVLDAESSRSAATRAPRASFQLLATPTSTSSTRTSSGRSATTSSRSRPTARSATSGSAGPATRRRSRHRQHAVRLGGVLGELAARPRDRPDRRTRRARRSCPTSVDCPASPENGPRRVGGRRDHRAARGLRVVRLPDEMLDAAARQHAPLGRAPARRAGDGRPARPEPFQFGDWLDPDAPGDRPWEAKVSSRTTSRTPSTRTAPGSLARRGATSLGDPIGRWTYDGARRSRWQPRPGPAGATHASTTQTGCAVAARVRRCARADRGARSRQALAAAGPARGRPHRHRLPRHAAGAAGALAHRAPRRGLPDAAAPGAPVLALPGRPRRDDGVGAMGRDPAGRLDPPGTMTRAAATCPTERERSMLSFNHYAYGAVVDWVYRHVAGHRARPGAPRLPARASRRSRAAASTGRTPRSRRGYGRAAIDWRLDGDTVVVDVELPFGTTGEFTAPTTAASPVTVDGRPGGPSSPGARTPHGRRDVCRGRRPGTVHPSPTPRRCSRMRRSTRSSTRLFLPHDLVDLHGIREALRT